MILRHSIWYAVVLVVVWSALGEADRCENLQEPYFLFAGDGKSRLLVDGFTWSVSPTYLDQNYQVQVYTDSAMGLQFQGIQEIANDQNDLCAVDGGIHHYDYPYTGADMLRTINTSSLNCEYSQFVQYIAAANVTLNTTSIIASTPALPGFYITANLSTSDKEYLFTTYTDPATGHNLISSYKPNEFKITIDVYNFPWVAAPTSYPDNSSSYLTIGIVALVTLNRPWNLSDHYTDDFRTYEIRGDSLDGQITLAYTHENAFFADGELILRELQEFDQNLTNLPATTYGWHSMLSVCNHSAPPYHYSHLHYDPTIIALFSGTEEAPQAKNRGPEIAAIVVTLSVVAIVSGLAIAYWKFHNAIWNTKALE